MIEVLWNYWPMLLFAHIIVGTLAAITACWADGSPIGSDAVQASIFWLWPAFLVFFAAFGIAHFFHQVIVMPVTRKLLQKAEDDPV